MVVGRGMWLLGPPTRQGMCQARAPAPERALLDDHPPTVACRDDSPETASEHVKVTVERMRVELVDAAADGECGRRDQYEHAVHRYPARCAAGSHAAALLLLADAARRRRRAWWERASNHTPSSTARQRVGRWSSNLVEGITRGRG